jgi:hypothetical protein
VKPMLICSMSGQRAVVDALREEEQEERFHDYGAIGWCATLTQLRRLR